MTFQQRAVIHQALALLPISILQILMGCMLGWTPLANYYLRSENSEIPITEDEGNWAASCQQFGRILIAIPAGMIADKIGRKSTTIICATTCSGAWFLILVNTSYISLLYLSNFLLGIVYGICNTVLQMYIAELVSAELRGTFGSMAPCYFSIGSFSISIIGAFVSYKSMNLITCAISLSFFATLYWITESPYYLLSKNLIEEARKNLFWLRQGYPKEQIELEFLKMKINSEKQNQYSDNMNPFRRLLVRSNAKCLLIAFILTFFVSFTGYNSIKLNSAFIFPPSEFIKNSKTYPFINSCVEIIFCFITPLIIDRFKRRTFLIISSEAIFLILIISSALFFIYYETNIEIIYIRSLLLASYIVYSAIYIFTFIPITSVIRSELLPQSIRGIGSGLTAMSTSIPTFITIFLFPYLADWFGVYSNFFLYTIFCVLVTFVAFFWIPETKGKMLADLQSEMENSVKASKNPSQTIIIVESSNL